MNVYFFGDSISFGQYISVDFNWVTNTAITLHKKYPDKEINIINTSINGNTTRMALERMPYDVQNHNVDVLVVGFGMNDCNYWKTDHGVPRVSPMAFEANLKEIIARAYVFGTKRVVLRTNHPSPRKDIMTNTNITYAQSNEYYNTIIRKVASEDESCLFADMEKICLKYCEENGCSIDEMVLEDQIHLSLTGHKVYYDTFMPILERCVCDFYRSEE